MSEFYKGCKEYDRLITVNIQAFAEDWPDKWTHFRAISDHRVNCDACYYAQHPERALFGDNVVVTK